MLEAGPCPQIAIKRGLRDMGGLGKAEIGQRRDIVNRLRLGPKSEACDGKFPVLPQRLKSEDSIAFCHFGTNGPLA